MIGKHPRSPGEHVLRSEELGDVGRRGVSKYLLRLPTLQDAPGIEQDRHVAEEPGFREVVGDLKHRHPPLPVHSSELSARRFAPARVERTEWLVEQQDRRTAGERARERDELSLTARAAIRPGDFEAPRRRYVPQPRE